MIYAFEDYVIDADRYELRHHGAPCPIEPQVLQLLLYLIPNRDRVVSKRELLDHIWPEIFVREAALYQRLHQARQAVNDSGQTQRVIKTAHGKGYRFIAPVAVLDAADIQREAQDSPTVEATDDSALIESACPVRRGLSEERKLVSVLCGAPANVELLVENHGIEAFRRQQHTLWMRVKATMQRYEGFLQPWGDHGFLAVFGAPMAQEDHARRAVLAALDVHNILRESSLDAETQEPMGFRWRLGGHTGSVIVDYLDGADTPTVVGQTIDVAERLQALALPGELLISEATQRLMHGAVRSEAFGRVQMDDQSLPIMAYKVSALGPWRSFMGQQQAYTSPFVGRDDELGALQRLLARAEAGQGQVVTVVGEPGMGKSRLLYEFARQLDGRQCTYLEAHCLSYATATPYLPVRHMMRQLCDLTDADGPVAVDDKLNGTLTALGLDPDENAPYLLQLLGSSQGAEWLASQNPRMVKERTFDALRKLIRHCSQLSPLILAVENLHWIDPTSEAWLTSLVEDAPEIPLLLLATFRPGYRPLWMDKSNATQVALPRLGPKASQIVAQSVIQTSDLPASMVQTILDKAAGNPFFLEELARTALEQRDGKASDVVPDTVQGVLAARMDRLPAAERYVLQIAAVVGKDAPLSILQAVAVQPKDVLAQHLRHLQRAEFIYEKGQMSERVYTFKHALTQDVAYASLLGHTRRKVHRQTAEVLEARFPEIADTQPELVARHYTESGNYYQAATYWQKAGQRAAQHSAYEEAIGHLTQGLLLLQNITDIEECTRLELSLQALLGPVLMATQGQASTAVRATYSRAYALCQQVADSPQHFPVLRGLWNTHLLRGDHQTAQELAERLFELAQHLQNPAFLPWGYTVSGLVLFYRGTFARSHGQFAQGLDLYNHEQYRVQALAFAQNPGVVCQAFGAYALWFLGYPEQALRQSDAALAQARDLPSAFQQATALNVTSRIYHFCRDIRGALGRAQTLIALSSEYGFPLWLAQGQIQHGWALSMQGESREGLRQLQQGLASWRASGARLWLPYALSLSAEVFGKIGQPNAGLKALTEALSIVEATGERFWASELYRLQGELLLQQSGDNAAAAEACFLKALEVSREQFAKSLELRAAISLAQCWKFQGKHQDAYNTLMPIYSWFTEGFNTTDLQDAKRIVSDLS